ncbi:Zinc finger protein ADR1 [Madurella fahalii]|uniref:Zinc finger protein ADR1 n=1 Tax=Madurella fahalii TaxID=1157608 RepID=A0ABQ0G7P7_9PEZI
MTPSDSLDNIVVKPKRFQCARCQRRFARLEHLQRHERTHTQERPFLCKQCESSFTRSDLLIRHERLSHSRPGAAPHLQHGLGKTKPPKGLGKRLRARVSSRANNDSEGDDKLQPRPSPSPALSLPLPVTATRDVVVDLPGAVYGTCLSPKHRSPQPSPVPPLLGVDDAMTQEASALADSMPHNTSIAEPGRLSIDGDSDESLDGFTTFLESGALALYSLPSPTIEGQPLSIFSFDTIEGGGDGSISYLPSLPTQHNADYAQDTPEEPISFSRFCSRLPSVQPGSSDFESGAPPPNPDARFHCRTESPDSQAYQRKIFDVRSEDRQLVLRKLADFASAIPNFWLPTRLSLGRYLRGYVDGFHKHLPFLHIQSMSVQTCSIELLLAMAAVGAQYCFETEKGVELFQAARAIANERIRRKDAASISSQQGLDPPYSTSPTGSTDSSPHAFPGFTGLRSSTTPALGDNGLMQTAQALLILMAMATWAKHSEILREALAIQSILASIIRDDGLGTPLPGREGLGWEAWMWHESVLRTKYIVFCFFNLHCIVYNIPPLILNSELRMRLPCSAVEFKADTAGAWREARAGEKEPAMFQDAVHWLFSSDERRALHSSLGNYVLIHAIIQNIFLVRQTAGCRIDPPNPGLTAEDAKPLEHALRNWQLSWERSPESSLDPTHSNGPVAFNSTALLRLAYIRLSMDTGPGHALSTRDPVQIVHALRDTPVLKRSPRITRALLHSIHAFSIPIKIGVRLVARTQTFIWSVQHSLCSLECALLLSKWLEAVSTTQWPGTDAPLTRDEKRILALVGKMLDEADFPTAPEIWTDVRAAARHLNVGVLKVWAAIFRGPQTWAIVDVIGSSLDLYASMLEATT